MMNDKHRKIIEGLKRATQSGKIKWEETGLDRKFETSLGEYAINVYLIENNGAFQIMMPGTITAEMSFVDSQGEEFDSVKSYSTKDEAYISISQLYDLARRSASGTDEKLDDIISLMPF